MGKKTATDKRKARRRNAAGGWLRDVGRDAVGTYTQELALWLARLTAVAILYMLVSQLGGFAVFVKWALPLVQ